MWGAVWGSRPTETDLPYACDRFVDSPTLVAFRGITVQAPAEQVWPWVGQIRVAPYSYDWIDNAGRRSPRRLLGLPEPVVGERFTAVAGRPVGTIVDVEPGSSLTGRIGSVHMTYRLLPEGPARTRLLLKVVAPTPRVLASALCLGDLVMARKQLLTWRRLAEGAAPRR